MNDQTPKDEALRASTVAAPAAAPRRAARFVRIGALGAMVAGLAVWSADWIHGTLVYVHETDARISADMVAVSSRVAGWVVERPAKEGAAIGKGEAIALIDARDAELRHTELVAERDRIEAEYRQLAAEIAMVDSKTRSHAESEQARLAAARALVDAIGHEFEYADREFERARKLSVSGVIPARKLDVARTAYLRTQEDLVRARAQVATASALLTEAEAARGEIEVLERKRSTLAFRKAEVEARIERQRLNISDRVVTSPLAGVVSRLFVEAGEYVTPGQRIALVHDPDAIWVEANIRETEIRHLEPGQPVRLVVDAYPDRPFEGRVERIGHAATSEFALLPSPNPSGNFTKVTQRLPVRIAVTQQDGLLRPGMMVEIYIDIRGDVGGD
jgi:membrane fusion protein (multidrug efflux system)